MLQAGLEGPPSQDQGPRGAGGLRRRGDTQLPGPPLAGRSLPALPPAPHLRKSSSGRVDAGVPSAGQLRKWNCVSVRVSCVCTFFR